MLIISKFVKLKSNLRTESFFRSIGFTPSIVTKYNKIKTYTYGKFDDQIKY